MPRTDRNHIVEYKGDLYSATELFNRERLNVEKEGWHPIHQEYIEGRWGCAAFIFAAILCFVLIGILIFIYMLIVKPKGRLVVTYEHEDKNPSLAKKTCPECAEQVQKLAKKCKHCGYIFS